MTSAFAGLPLNQPSSLSAEHSNVGRAASYPLARLSPGVDFGLRASLSRL
jgi:hypothetical protein